MLVTSITNRDYRKMTKSGMVVLKYTVLFIVRTSSLGNNLFLSSRKLLWIFRTTADFV